MSGRLVAIAAPYTADTHYGISRNIEKARHLAALCWERGYYVFCPHLNTAFFSGLVPEEQFYEAALEFVRRSDILVCSIDWFMSKGAEAEYILASSIGIPSYVYPDLPPKIER